MNRESGRIHTQEPQLGGQRALHLSGMEPALSREFGPLYGRFRVEGLEAPPVMGRRRPLTVLADYDPDTAQLIHLLADSNGYEVRHSDDGLEAWRLARSLEPDLMVVGIRLTGIDGFEVIKRIRSDPNPTLRRVPLLVMDVRHRQQDVWAAFTYGADDYLEMPYDVPVMLRCWRRVLSSVRRPSPLTALHNEDAMIQQVALCYLLDVRPEGLVAGLGDLMWHQDSAMRASARWALRQLGTDEALAVLEQYRTAD